ncbi:hypothetical protein IVA80_15310 [Bradyrhizobium sp. 139]|uniref:hypothetical protein n=1 Tax=Bradyrhizobium sp. 139 TaxID=2782616 RepID=UPI001FFB601D|nr:hypothetical protein [Bradyrhizobium sp. 139]MCK1742192.1 hypothetical protein [Bradyrhizobium sp. 139]
MSIWLQENERNAKSAELLKAIVREVYGATEIGVGHHIMWSTGSCTDEQPSVDTLMFDHHVAKTLWGESWREVLTALALEPAVTRDEVLRRLYYGRS